MGSDSNYSVNSTDSTIKGNVESWFNSTISDYADILESNANYCNDRSSFTSATGTTATTSIRPYTTSTNTAYGVRPVISLKKGATSFSGSGTATDPWVVSPPPQSVTMQSVTSSELNSMMPNTGDTTTLVDSRDGQEYSITKLADGKFWMTENLNLAGGTAVSANNTDVDASYISSFSTSNNLTKSGSTIVLPASSTSGFDTNNYSYVYNSGNKSSNCSSPGCYSYYSWDAATLGSGRNIWSDDTDAPYSICPKGWHLPSTRTGTDSSSDFRRLMIGLGGSSSTVSYSNSTSPTGTTMSSTLQASPNNFLLAGNYRNGSLYLGGSDGYYWSSTSYSSSNSARYLYFYSSNVYSATYDGRYWGLSLRCLKGSE